MIRDGNGMAARKTGAGAATHGGIRYQDLVAAWFATKILAEQDAEPPLELGAGVHLTWLGCETDEPVDDVNVRTSRGGHLFCQAKRSLSAEEAADSEFASVLDQFVRQYAAGCSQADHTRPLDPDRDRLVLVTSSSSPSTVRSVLADYLCLARALPEGQDLDPTSLTKPQGEIHRKIVDHIDTAWRRARGTSPTSRELISLLRLMRVLTLDVEPDGAQEREAKELLRRSILVDTIQVESAWSHLTRKCLDFGTDRSQADRSRLQDELLLAGFKLKVARSYRADIERLQQYSHRITEAQVTVSAIRLGGNAIRVVRPIIAALVDAVEAASLLVVGEPGAGKSVAVADLAQTLRDAGRDIVYLNLAGIDTGLAIALRVDPGLEHDLTEILENWPGTEPGFLIIDTLDPARADGSVRLIQEVLRSGSRWRVLAAIREYDLLRLGGDLKVLFQGEPVTNLAATDFPTVRHIRVPVFSDEELDQVAAQSPVMASLLTSAARPLRGLLHNPFNLRLAAEILGSGTSAETLSPIRSQVELLDRYWECRVLGDVHSDARELVLRRTAEGMVRAKRRPVPRSEIAADPALSLSLHQVLSSRVLSEWRRRPDLPADRGLLSFAHEILFDYAVATLLLRNHMDEIIPRLEADPDLSLVIRSCLVLFFQSEWLRDPTRVEFWATVHRLARSAQLPEDVRVIGPGVAAELIVDPGDCQPLFVALDVDDPLVRGEAERTLDQLANWLLAEPTSCSSWPAARAWCGIVERISRSLRPAISVPVAKFLRRIIERSALLTEQARVEAGQSARRVVEFAWVQRPRNGPLVRVALEAVCATYTGDPVASRNLLRRALEPQHLAEHGHQELSVLANQVSHGLTTAADFVMELYATAFRHRESSDAATTLNTGQVFALRSNRQQDYDLGVYQLGEAFPGFLARSPAWATRALIAAVEGHLRDKVTGEPIIDAFDFVSRPAQLLTDDSSVWDTESTHRYEPILKMLDEFERFLIAAARDRTRDCERELILDVIVSENRAAAVWRRLLRAGAAVPHTLGWAILPLAFAVPILVGQDTSSSAAEYLVAIFGTLTVEERRQIEGVIHSLPETMTGQVREPLEQVRDRLLGALADSGLVTLESMQCLAGMEARGGLHRDDPSFATREAPGREFTEEDELTASGIDLTMPANRMLHVSMRPIRDFYESHRNSTPSREQIETISPALLALQAVIAETEMAGAHRLLLVRAWGYLAAAAGRIMWFPELGKIQQLGVSVRALLLEASVHPHPTPDTKTAGSFATFPGWNSAEPRLEAAAGLMVLAREPRFADMEVLDAIRRLAVDPVPAVRYQVASRLIALFPECQDLMWELFDGFTRNERNAAVLGGLVPALHHLPDTQADRVAALTSTILDRMPPDSDPLIGRRGCIQTLARLDLVVNHEGARAVVRQFIDHPVDRVAEVRTILFDLRTLLTLGPVDSPDPQRDAIRRRAFQAVEDILERAIEERDRLRDDWAAVAIEERPQAVQRRLKQVFEIIDDVAQELYLASGAFQDGARGRDGSRTPLDSGVRRRFLQESAACFERLIEHTIPGVAYHLIEMMETFIPVDPRDVLLRVSRIVRAYEREGYQHDGMAMMRVAAIVERYLNNHRDLLLQDAECRSALRQIMDVFVRAGWPEALRLSSRLDQIFR
jgi:hypothetical protein